MLFKKNFPPSLKCFEIVTTDSQSLKHAGREKQSRIANNYFQPAHFCSFPPMSVLLCWSSKTKKDKKQTKGLKHIKITVIFYNKKKKPSSLQKRDRQ